jgi:hypothetical protein
MILFGKWIQNGIPTFGRVCRQRRTFRAVRNVSQMLLLTPQFSSPFYSLSLPPFPEPAAVLDRIPLSISHSVGESFPQPPSALPR